MNNKLKSILEDVVMTQLGYYPSNCLEALRKTTKNSIRMDNALVKI
jgi:hypothetical protein